MTILTTLVGAALIVVALCDIFQQLFHPSGGGSLSQMLMQGVWRGFCRVAAGHGRGLDRAKSMPEGAATGATGGFQGCYGVEGTPARDGKAG